MLIDRIQPPFVGQSRDNIELLDNHPIGPCDQILIGLPIDEAKQHDDENREYARNRQRPAEGGRMYDLTPDAYRDANFLFNVGGASHQPSDLWSGAKNKAGTADIVYHGNFTRAVHLMAQAAHMHVDKVGRRDEFVVPNLLQKHGSRQQLIATLHHIFEQAKFAWQADRSRDRRVWRCARSDRVPAALPATSSRAIPPAGAASASILATSSTSANGLVR